MFSFLNKSSKPSYPDKVWKTKSSCLRGVATEGLKALTQSKTPVVFFFFPGDQKRFIKFLESSKAPFLVVESGSIPQPHSSGSLLILNAFLVESSSSVRDFLLSQSQSSPLRLFFAGHYPLPDPENKVLEKLSQLLGAMDAVFCLSLEDGLLQAFGSERIKPLMDTLGMADDDCIEHAMVSKAISRAREKLAEKIVSEVNAETEELWFVKNANPLEMK